MLYAYAESLISTLCNSKLGFVMDKLDYYNKECYINENKDMFSNLEDSDIIHIEKIISDIRAQRFLKNLCFIVLNGYNIRKFATKDFSILNNTPNMYMDIWHNSSVMWPEKSFLEYSYIELFDSFQFSKSAKDP